jgi:hypothetical protein
MSGDQDQCRADGARCEELAVTARTPELKAVFMELAMKWQALAADAERAQGLLNKVAKR